MGKWFKTDQAPEDGLYWWSGNPNCHEPILCQMRTKMFLETKNRVWRSILDGKEEVLKAGAGGWWCKFESTWPVFDGEGVGEIQNINEVKGGD